MMLKKQQAGVLEKLATGITRFAGGTTAFVIAVFLVLGWIGTGPFFRYSPSWQMLFTTATTVVTFLMVFLIQRSQNKDSLALQLKMNEIVAALAGASNRLVNVEDLSEAELAQLHEHYCSLAELAEKERNHRSSRSIDDTEPRPAER